LSAVQEELLGVDEEEVSELEPLDGASTNAGPQSAAHHQDPTAAEGSTAQTQDLPKPADLGRIAKRIVDLLEEDEANTGPLERLYSRTTARVFAEFCDALLLDRTAVNLNSRAAKKTLFSLLMTEVCLSSHTFYCLLCSCSY
jgi:hypothetical protein